MEYGSEEDNNDDGGTESVMSAQERVEQQGEDAYDVFDDRYFSHIAWVVPTQNTRFFFIKLYVLLF